MATLATQLLHNTLYTTPYTVLYLIYEIHYKNSTGLDEQ